MKLDKLPDHINEQLAHEHVDVFLNVINALISSGKARIETGMVASSFKSDGTFDMAVKSRLIIELGEVK